MPRLHSNFSWACPARFSSDNFLGEGLLAVAVGLPLEPVVNRGERDVRLDEIRCAFEDGFELGAGRVEVPRCEFDGGELILGAQITGAHAEGAVEKVESGSVVVIQLKQGSQLQI